MIDLAELEFKARAATKGEWDVFENLGQDEAWCDWHRVGPFDMTGGKASADDLFIQASRPSIVLELIERVRAAEAKAAEPVAWVPTRALEKLAADGAHIGVQTVIYSCERSSFQPLYAAAVDVSALQKRLRVLEEALRNALAVIVTTGPTQTHDHFGDRKLLNSTVAQVAGVLNAALGDSNG